MDLEKGKYLSTVFNVQDSTLSDEVRTAILRDLRKKYFNKNDKFLDIGTGIGKWMLALKSIGYKNICVCDATDEKREFFEAKGITFKKAYLGKENLPWENETFDVLTSFEVIEHLLDPECLMLEAKRVLKTGGCFITVCPDWRRCYKTFYLDPTHVRPYDKESLGKMYAFYGFKVIECKNFWVKSPLGITRLWKIIRPLLYSGHSMICIGKKL